MSKTVLEDGKIRTLRDEIAGAVVPAGSARLWWLGQAGFACKTHAGRVILLDPYLSDAVERLHGFKRLSPAPLNAEEARADLVLITHEHADHLDPDALPVIARNNPACRFAAPAGCSEGLTHAGIREPKRVLLEADRRYDLDGVTVYTAMADHGALSLTALSLLLDCGGVRIMFSGDTALSPAMSRVLYDLKPDLLLPCINGAFGNMGPTDAAIMAQQAKPQMVIPCHFGMFAEQGGDPAAFLDACKRICPDIKAVLLKPGEGITIRGRPS